MPPARTCSECGNSLEGTRPGTKTCSNAHRQERSRRLRRAKRNHEEFEANNPEGAQEIARIVRREAPDVIHKILGDELKPIVRDAITEDVLRAISQMVGLTPRAVELMAKDLESEDSTIRQRAYTLITKYTIGHPALVKPDEGNQGHMTVNFNLPRPDDVAENGEFPLDAESLELKRCDMCGADKPTNEFVAGSERCEPCYTDWQKKVLKRFAK